MILRQYKTNEAYVTVIYDERYLTDGKPDEEYQREYSFPLRPRDMLTERDYLAQNARESLLLYRQEFIARALSPGDTVELTAAKSVQFEV